MNIEHKLQELIDLKEGDKELAVFYVPGIEKPWRIDLGNPCHAVMLGESSGEIQSEGATLAEAIDAMRTLLVRPNDQVNRTEPEG